MEHFFQKQIPRVAHGEKAIRLLIVVHVVTDPLKVVPVMGYVDGGKPRDIGIFLKRDGKDVARQEK